MTNSRGESLFKGEIEPSGVVEGGTGTGRMDHRLNVTVRIRGHEYEKSYDIPTGAKIESIYVDSKYGTFSPHWVLPPKRPGEERGFSVEHSF